MADSRRHFNLGPDGYRHFRQVVPMDNVKKAVEAITSFAGIDADNPASWGRLPAGNAGIIPLHHSQAFWDNRQHPAVHAAFKEVYGCKKLWVTMDRAIFRPPLAKEARVRESEGWYLGYGDIHWDIDPGKPHPGGVQGVLLLSETPAESGGFHCIPEIYRDLAGWLQRHPGMDWKKPDVSPYQVTHVTGQPGDLIIWDPFLPHGASRNFYSRPRIAQYITMTPLPELRIIEQERADRIRLFNERRVPDYWRVAGQPAPEPGPPVVLTALGRKLVGFDSWDWPETIVRTLKTLAA